MWSIKEHFQDGAFFLKIIAQLFYSLPHTLLSIKLIGHKLHNVHVYYLLLSTVFFCPKH